MWRVASILFIATITCDTPYMYYEKYRILEGIDPYILYVLYPAGIDTPYKYY